MTILDLCAIRDRILDDWIKECRRTGQEKLLGVAAMYMIGLDDGDELPISLKRIQTKIDQAIEDAIMEAE